MLLAGPLLVTFGNCFAQELEHFPDAELTGQQWQQRVQDARRRSEEFVAKARTQQTLDPPSSDRANAEAADRRAMNDPSLQRGDIIATSRGFVVFIGRDSDERQPADFLPATSPR
jgi:lysozyme family protein